MGILDKIKGAIFGTHAKAETPAPGGIAPTPPVSSPAPVPPTAAPSPSGGTAAPVPSATPQPQAAPSGSAAAPVDVAEILDKAVKSKGETLDWRHSIVDMMKALDLDSSLASRKELAEELHYTGDTGDSATMNMWLHKALMKKLAENGGKVPADLTD